MNCFLAFYALSVKNVTTALADVTQELVSASAQKSRGLNSWSKAFIWVVGSFP